MRAKIGIAQMEVKNELVEHALRDYEHELISLGRLAELLGVDRVAAQEIVEARGMQVRVAPTSIEEALEDARVAQSLSEP